MSVTNSTGLNDLIGSIVTRDVQGNAYANRVMRPLIRSHYIPPGFDNITVPKFDAVAIAALTEGVAPSSTSMTTSGVKLTPTERGVYVQISKHVLHVDPFADLAPYGAELGRALAADEDSLVLDKLALSGATRVNTGSSAASLTTFREAIAVLEANNAPQPYAAVFHPTTWSKIRGDLSNAAYFAGPGTQIVEGFGPGAPNANSFVGSVYGIPCFISTQVSAADAATPTRRDNYVFSREAVACAYLNDIGIDVMQNVPARAFDLMAWYTVDCKLLVSSYVAVMEDTLT